MEVCDDEVLYRNLFYVLNYFIFDKKMLIYHDDQKILKLVNAQLLKEIKQKLFIFLYCVVFMKHSYLIFSVILILSALNGIFVH